MIGHRPAVTEPAVGAVTTPWAKARAWAWDIAGILAVGLALPVAILVVGSPIAAAARFVIELFTRL